MSTPEERRDCDCPSCHAGVTCKIEKSLTKRLDAAINDRDALAAKLDAANAAFLGFRDIF